MNTTDADIAQPGTKPMGQAQVAPKTLIPADTDRDLLSEYVAECMEHIGAAEAALLDLETDPDAPEPVNTVFRAFHTIKGTSGFLGLEPVRRLAHLSENQLDRARRGEIRLLGGYADLVLESCDTLKAMIAELATRRPGDALQPPVNFERLLQLLACPEAAGISSETSAGASAPRVGDLLVAQGIVTRETVEQAAKQAGGERLGKRLITRGAASASQVSRALRLQRRLAVAEGATVRVGTERLEELLGMLGELADTQRRIAAAPYVRARRDRRLADDVAHLGETVATLRDLTAALRRAPLKPVFQRLARLARDLARLSGKKLQLRTAGDELEVDRDILELLNAPLVHLVRNACDHGIEPPEARRAVGKAETGTVEIRAAHRADRLVMDLSDDGRGLDTVALAATAVEGGFVEPDAGLSDEAILRLVFVPGLSTAGTATSLSGRGVGLDVVRRQVESIGGTVHVASGPGRGATFTLSLPLSAAADRGRESCAF
jgi:two-component system chemotaxis sensor kinase CheA